MTSDERTYFVERYWSAVADLDTLLDTIPREAWQYRVGPDRWSIHEIIVHLADSESNGYGRCRRAIAEPGGDVMAYDQDLWSKRLGYLQTDVDDALALVRLVRKLSHQLIQRISDETWSNTLDHPEIGHITLERWLVIYSHHIPDHIRQIERTYDAWKRHKAGESVDPNTSLFEYSESQ